MSSGPLPRLAARVPQRVRRRVPMRVRNALVARLGHPADAFDASAFPRKVNLGAGYDKREGFVNVDIQAFHDPDLVGDVRSLPELPTGRYEEVLAQDVLEHLERADGPVALREWRRLLAPGGRLELRVPDLPSLVAWLNESDDPDRHRQVMHFMFGTQAYNGDFHLSGYTDVLLCDELRQAGFVGAELQRRDDWLWEGEAFAPGPVDRPLDLVWGQGFYQRETADGAEWRWGARGASLLVYTPEAVTAELRLTVLDGPVRVRGGDVDAELSEGEHPIPLVLTAGANRLRFSADTVRDVAGDQRELAFQLGGRVSTALR